MYAVRCKQTKSDGAKMIRKIIVDTAKSLSMDQILNQIRYESIYTYMWDVSIYTMIPETWQSLVPSI